MIFKIILVALSLFGLPLSSNAYGTDASSPISVLGSSVGRAKTSSEAYSNAWLQVPSGARVYRTIVLKAATKNDFWTYTLLWRQN